jgi:hypothetical protein
MRPDVPRVLNGIAMSLATDIMREVQTPFGQNAVSHAAGLLMMIGQEFDRAAARLVEENTAILAILARAQSSMEDPGLQDRITRELGEIPGQDLRVSALQAENDRLRTLLIDVHAAVEAAPGAEAEALDRLIWDELRESTRRRHLAMMR